MISAVKMRLPMIKKMLETEPTKRAKKVESAKLAKEDVEPVKLAKLKEDHEMLCTFSIRNNFVMPSTKTFKTLHMTRQQYMFYKWSYHRDLDKQFKSNNRNE